MFRGESIKKFAESPEIPARGPVTICDMPKIRELTFAARLSNRREQPLVIKRAGHGQQLLAE